MSSINDKLSDPAFQQKSIERAENLQPAGPGKIKVLINKIKGKIQAVKEFTEKINDAPDSFIDFNGDGPLLADAKRKLKKKITDLKAKHKKKIEGKLKTDIFSQMIDLVDTFLNKKNLQLLLLEKHMDLNLQHKTLYLKTDYIF